MNAMLVFHVAISLVGILAGLIVLTGLLTANRMSGWTLLFLATTVATSVTGFLLPFSGFTPAVGVGILSVVVLALAIAARYKFHLAGAWRWLYVAGAVTALYLNVFVLVVQAFLKVPALHALAPQGTEPAFAITQGIVLLGFVAAGVLSVQRFHPAQLPV